jgi:hypothetical protein
MSVLIIDNGAAKIKFGFDKDEKPQGASANCTAHVRKQMLSYVGDQVDSAVNGSVLQYNRYRIYILK